MHYVKLFVGNIPYKCTQEDIDKCFLNITGFIKADIIHEEKTTKGYGFIIINNLHNAQQLQQRSDVILNGRTLRFIEYQNEKNTNVNNYIYITNIPNGKNREWLKQIFSQYAPIGKYFIIMNQKTGQYTNTGIIEILNNTHYLELIKNKHHVINNITLGMQKYKIK